MTDNKISIAEITCEVTHTEFRHPRDVEYQVRRKLCSGLAQFLMEHAPNVFGNRSSDHPDMTTHFMRLGVLTDDVHLREFSDQIDKIREQAMKDGMKIARSRVLTTVNNWGSDFGKTTVPKSLVVEAFNDVIAKAP